MISISDVKRLMKQASPAPWGTLTNLDTSAKTYVNSPLGLVAASVPNRDAAFIARLHEIAALCIELHEENEGLKRKIDTGEWVSPEEEREFYRRVRGEQCGTTGHMGCKKCQ